MNENPTPGVTPNPTPEPTPQPQPSPMGMPEAAPITPQPTPTFAPNSTPAPGQVETPYAPVTPTATPTEPMPGAAPKKKTGLIVGVLVTVLVVCGVIAAFLFLNSKKDPDTIVYNAFANLLADEKGNSTNTTFDGSISIGAMGMSIYDLSINGKTTEGAAELNLSLTPNAMLGIDMDVEANVIFKDKNVFAKAKGLSNLLGGYGTDVDLSGIEDTWFQANIEEFSKLVEENSSIYPTLEDVEFEDDDATNCVTNELESLATKRKEILNLYQSNKFLTAAKNTNTNVTAKKDTLYEVKFSGVKFADFINAFISSNLFSGILNCADASIDDFSPIEIDDSYEAMIPTIYVEVNGNEELTRFYLPFEAEDSEIIIDFSIDHPAKVEILEPTDAKSFMEFLLEEVATPSIMHSQRDTQRRADYATLESAIVNYQTNNRGKMPTTTSFIDSYIEDDWMDPTGIDYNVTIKDGKTSIPFAPSEVGTIYIVTSAECDDESVEHNSDLSDRRFAVWGYLESGTYCASN